MNDNNVQNDNSQPLHLHQDFALVHLKLKHLVYSKELLLEVLFVIHHLTDF